MGYTMNNLSPPATEKKPPPPVSYLVSLLRHLKPSQRIEVFNNFCKSCGDENPRCHCTHDD